MIHVKLLQPKALIPFGAENEPMIHCGMTPTAWTINGYECKYFVNTLCNGYSMQVQYKDPYKSTFTKNYSTMIEVIDAINEHNERHITDTLNHIAQAYDDVLNFCHDYYNED